MKKIGILFGMENTFPPALVEKINSMRVDGVKAEFVKLGGVKMADPSGYRVIIDRISQDIPFYRAYLKNAALNGTIVINNPFWWTADDKFFNYALATKLGVAIPPTVILPHNKHPEGTTDQSMRNLMFPLNWDEIFRNRWRGSLERLTKRSRRGGGQIRYWGTATRGRSWPVSVPSLSERTTPPRPARLCAFRREKAKRWQE